MGYKVEQAVIKAGRETVPTDTDTKWESAESPEQVAGDWDSAAGPSNWAANPTETQPASSTEPATKSTDNEYGTIEWNPTGPDTTLEASGQDNTTVD